MKRIQSIDILISDIQLFWVEVLDTTYLKKQYDFNQKELNYIMENEQNFLNIETSKNEDKEMYNFTQSIIVNLIENKI
jgi:hypothetical protein